MYGEVIVTGILVSLIFTEMTGISPGGLIVAGYLALSLSSPVRPALTVLVVLLTLVVYSFISRYTILYGRRRFAVMVLISMTLGWGITALPFSSANLGIVGYLIPGILAKECDRQGIAITLLATAGATAITVLVCLVLGVALF